MTGAHPAVWAALDAAKAKRDLAAPSPADTETDCCECQGTGLSDGPDGPPCVYCDGSGVWT